MVAVRNPDLTRSKLLQAAFNEMYQNGYQGMRVDDILRCTGLKKGAFYHHFKSKLQLGYAVLDEVIGPEIQQRWIIPLAEHKDPVSGIQQVIRDFKDNAPGSMLECGCPLNNLAQEMSPLDEGFRERIASVYRAWVASIAEALKLGQEAGYIRRGIRIEAVAAYIVACLGGTVSLAKASRDEAILKNCEHGLNLFLNSLRPELSV